MSCLRKSWNLCKPLPVNDDPQLNTQQNLKQQIINHVVNITFVIHTKAIAAMHNNNNNNNNTFFQHMQLCSYKYKYNYSSLSVQSLQNTLRLFVLCSLVYLLQSLLFRCSFLYIIISITSIFLFLYRNFLVLSLTLLRYTNLKFTMYCYKYVVILFCIAYLITHQLCVFFALLKLCSTYQKLTR